MNSSTLSLHKYNGSLLTEEEISLSKYYENKKNSFYNEEEDILRERQLLAQTQRLLELPSIRDITEKKKINNDNNDNDSNNNNNDNNSNNNDVYDDIDVVVIKPNSIEELKRKYDEIHENDDSNKQISNDTTKDIVVKSNKDIEMKKKKVETTTKVTATTTPTTTSSSSITTTKTNTPTTDKKRSKKISKLVEDTDNYSGEDDSIPDFYTSAQLLQNVDWDSSILSIGKTWELKNFDLNYKQTLVLKVTIPMNANKWAINLSPTNNFKFNDILFHSNFRKNKKCTVLNDKIGTWGNGLKLQYPQSKSYEVMIQIRKEGFCLFIDDNYWGILCHRRNIEEFNEFILSIPAYGDDFEPETVIVHKIWWGYKAPEFHVIPSDKLKASMAEQQEKIPDTPYYSRTLCISGLPPSTDREMQYSQEIALKEIFSDFESVFVMPHDDIAFVRFHSRSQVDTAIEDYEGEMQMEGEKGGIYTLKLFAMDKATL